MGGDAEEFWIYEVGKYSLRRSQIAASPSWLAVNSMFWLL